MVRWIGRVLLGLLVMAAVVYVGDFAVWRARVARGGGMASVEMQRVVVAPLKGNKEEYYPDGTEVEECSASLFPQAGGGACWWLRGHRTVEER